MSLNYSIDEVFDIGKIEPPFRKIFDLAMPFLKTRFNLPHTFIAYQYAQLLLQEESGSQEIVLPACILHDVGWSRIPKHRQVDAFGPFLKDNDSRRKHEMEGVVIAGKILTQVGYNSFSARKIMQIIDGHDTTPEARSLEDAITKDSDKLFRFSALGFRIGCERFRLPPEDYWPYLSTNMEKWVLTATGKKIAVHEAGLRASEFPLSLSEKEGREEL